MRILALLTASAIFLPMGSAKLKADEIDIRVPFVRVKVGGPRDHARVYAPFTRVRVPRKAQRHYVQREPLGEALPAPRARPASVAHAPVRVPTHREFARTFRPAPGRYEVVMLHPYTKCPVKVCFDLPHGCPDDIRCDRNELEFDYDDLDLEVEIHFRRNGRVFVKYED